MIQGSKSVKEYFQDMETLMIRASITEDDDKKVAQFLGGLNRQIVDIIELQPQGDLEDVVNLAIKVEKQLQERRKSELQISTPNTNEVVEEAKCVETVVEVEEIVACGDNEKVVDISMPTTMFESSDDEVTEEFVVEYIEEVIDIPESVTTLDNNKCAVIDVEKNKISALN